MSYYLPLDLGVSIDPKIEEILLEAKKKGDTIKLRHSKVVVCGAQNDRSNRCQAQNGG